MILRGPQKWRWNTKTGGNLGLAPYLHSFCMPMFNNSQENYTPLQLSAPDVEMMDLILSYIPFSDRCGLQPGAQGEVRAASLWFHRMPPLHSELSEL